MRNMPIISSVTVHIVALCLLVTPAIGATPSTVLFEGVLTATGGPASDGDYPLRFRIYADQSAKVPLWSEGPVSVTVQGARFDVALGNVQPLDLAALATATTPQLGVQVGDEPELPRLPLHAVLYALRAGSADSAEKAKNADNANFAKTADVAKIADVAKGLACTGCVSVKALLFDGDVDLAGHSLKAASATFTGDVVAKTVTAAAFVGDGSKLTGVPSPSGSCKDGELVKSITLDGSLICAAAGVGTLPSNGLGAISNGTIVNEFVDTFGQTAAVPIPDNSGASAGSAVLVPDIGDAETLALHVEVVNSDLGALAIVLLPPDDKKVGWVLCDPCGKTDDKSYKQTFDGDHPPKSGDIGAWIGKNPKGGWTLKVTDTSFCVPQKPGNAPLCDLGNATDGEIAAFSLTMKTASSSKVEAKGVLLASGGFRFPLFAKEPFVCDSAHIGYSYLNTSSSRLFVCNGIWRAVLLQECGNGVIEFGEACDDGVSNSDSKANACRTSCQKAGCGDKIVDSGETCDDGNKDDGDSCRNNCTVPCSGWLYKGVCLMANDLSSNAEAIPNGCTPDQPNTGWGIDDYVSICNHFQAAGTTCSSVDTDADGGLCNNFKAIASWESNANPDVWVHTSTFAWNPTTGNQNCNLYSAVGKVVYACK